MVKKSVGKLKPLVSLQKGKQIAANHKNFPADFFGQVKSKDGSKVAMS